MSAILSWPQSVNNIGNSIVEIRLSYNFQSPKQHLQCSNMVYLLEKISEIDHACTLMAHFLLYRIG